MKIHRSNSAAALAFVTCLISTVPTAFAAAFTWDGGGGTTSWGTGDNWNPDGASFNNTTDLTFAGSGAQTYTGVGTVGGSRNIRSLTYNDSFTSSTGRIRLNSGGASTSGNANNLIFNSSTATASITITSGMTGAVDIGAGGSTVFGETQLASNLTITNNSSVGTLSITSNITETTAGKGITKNGVGLVTLTRPCSFTGPTTINAGTLRGNLTGDCANSELILNNTAATFMVGVGSTTADWTCKDFTAAAAGTLQFNFTVTPGTTVSPLVVTNLANFTATPNVSVLVSSVPSDGTYPLMTWGSTSGTVPTTANLTLSKFEFGKTTELQLAGNTLNLAISSVTPYVIKENNVTDLGLGGSWVGGSAPIASQGAKWTNSVTSPNTTVLGADVTWGGIIIEDPAGPVAIGSGNILTLGGGGIDLSTATADLTLDCALALAGSQTWNVASGRTLFLNSLVSGNSGFTKQGAGTTILAANNTWAGDATVSAGTLKLAIANAIPDGAGKGNLSIAGTLDLNGLDEQINGLSGTGVVDTTAAGAPSNFTVGGNNQTATFSGILQNSGSSSTLNLVKTGTGLQILSGANAHTGLTTVNAGALRISNSGALGSTGAGTLVNGGTGGTGVARLELAGGITVSGEAVTIKGAGNFVGALTSQSGTNTWAGNVTIDAASTRIGASLSSTLVVSGVIDSGANPHGLLIRNEGTALSGTVVLSGANTYLGDTSLLIGRLKLDGGNNRLPVSTGMIIGNSTNTAELDLNGTSQELAGLSLASGATAANNSVNNSSLSPSTLTVNAASASSSFGGILKGNLALIKTGANILTLSGTNVYTGETTVSGGTLILGASNVLPDSSPIFLGAASLGVAAASTDSTGPLSVTGAATVNLGDATSSIAFADSSTLTWSGSLNLTGTFVPGFSLKFGSTAGGLASGQLAAITADGWTSFALDENGFLTATSTGGSPEIAVEQPAATDIANGGSQDFGAVAPGSNNSLVFTIRNTGTASLNLTGSPLVAVSGTNASDFTITAAPTTPVTSGGGSTTFTVQFSPAAAGTRSAVLTIANNDSDEGTFTINISGTGQTQYDAWAGGAAFDADANGDGVKNGLAFLLGAASPTSSVTMPSTSQSGGNLTMSFACLNAASRGGAVLNVEHSSNLGISDPWTTVAVPDVSGGPSNGVTFTVTPGSPANSVTATISNSEAASGKLFGRLKAQNP